MTAMRRVLFTGRGSSGSWEIRGRQIAQALGAEAVPMALDLGAYDVAVVVKRAPLDLQQRIRRAGARLVWDIVDAWPQPDGADSGNEWGRPACMAWLGQRLAEIRPDAVVAATQRMAEDVRAITRVPVLPLPHHARPGLGRTPIRPQAAAVVYEGSARQLGTWGPWLTQECQRFGLRFLHNPPGGLAAADIVVALRDRNGYAATCWKSNVKLANAQAAGLPFIAARESGYTETASGVECWAESREAVLNWLARLQTYEARAAIAERMAAATPHLNEIARTYARWLETL